MKNSYIIAGVIVLAALLGFVVSSKKTEAPEKPLTEVENKAESAVLSPGTYKIDTTSSKVSWTGEYLTGLKETGTVSFQSGNFEVAEDGTVSGEFVVDMNTIASVPFNERLVGHLKNDDFFSVDKYSTATFKLKSMTPSSEEGQKMGRYVLGGDLTIKGINKPISIIANITNDPEGDGNSLIAKSSFAINRADWDIKYNSPTFFKNLGEKIIRDAVTIELDLKGQKVIQ